MTPAKATSARPRKYEPGWSGETRGGQLGKYTAEDCPRKGCSGKIVYNGNNFCEFWAWHPDEKPVDYEAGECDYALPHPQVEYQDRLLSWNLDRTWECELPESYHRHITKPRPGEICLITWPINGGIVKNRDHLRVESEDK